MAAVVGALVAVAIFVALHVTFQRRAGREPQWRQVAVIGALVIGVALVGFVAAQV